MAGPGVKARTSVPSAPPTPPLMRQAAAWTLGLVVASAGLLPGKVLAQRTGAEVFQRAVDAFETRMEGIQSYTVVQDFAGFRSEVRWERSASAAGVRFVPSNSSTVVPPGDLGGTGIGHLGTSVWNDPFAHFLAWGEGATLVGRDVVEGRGVWLVRVENFGNAEMGLTPGTFAEGHFRPERGTFAIDAEDWVLRRVQAEGILDYNGAARVVQVDANLRDYRTVDGVLHPFIIELRMHGLAPGQSPLNQGPATDELTALLEQLEDLPARQRESLARLLGVQVDRLEELARGEITMVLRTLEVRANRTDR